MEFRKRIVQSFPILYKEHDEGDGDRFADYTETAQFGKKWGWYSSIYRVAKGDVTKFDSVTSLNVFTALTFLSYEIEKDQVMDMIHQREINKYKR